MAEIRALPPNGLKVVSTFSGGGGSSCGYAMVGFKVLWASEFIDAARDTYAVNFPTTILDGRDIRTVTAEDILAATGLKVGELDVFDGSPPCSAFSTAGKRDKGWGIAEKKYSDKSQASVEDLFFEYARLLKGLQPRAFVAENVSGLVKGVGKGYFIEILKALEAAGYVVSARLLDAQWLGVPQTRQRLIFVGFRKDLGIAPVHPLPLPYRYTIREVFDGMRIVMNRRGDGSEWGQEQRSFDKNGHRNVDLPAPSVMVGGMAGMNNSQVKIQEVPKEELRVVHDTSGAYGTGDVTDRPCPAITVGVDSINSYHYKVFDRENRRDRASETQAERDERDMGVGCYGAIGKEWEKLKPGETSEKFFNLVRSDEDRPCQTVTAIGGIPGAASVTHPTEARKFTIAELRRICSFPDDFQLLGSYQQQWERCGRAVPPVMMSHVAAAVRDALRAHDGLPPYDPAASPPADEALPPVRRGRPRGRR